MMRTIVRLFLLGMGAFTLAIGWLLLAHLTPAIGWLERTGFYLVLVVMDVLGCLWLGAFLWFGMSKRRPEQPGVAMGRAPGFRCEIKREGCKIEAQSYCPETDQLMCTSCDQWHTCSLPTHHAPQLASAMRATFPRVKAFRQRSASAAEGKDTA